MKPFKQKPADAMGFLRGLATPRSKSRGNSWWQLMALMSVSAVMIAAIFTVGNELELKKDYVQASEPAGKLQALIVTDKNKRRNPLRLEVTTDRWVYAAKGSFAALLGADLTEETLGHGDRQLCAPQRAICVPIEGRVPVSGAAGSPVSPHDTPSQTPPVHKE